jgi:hypothetical protein
MNVGEQVSVEVRIEGRNILPAQSFIATNRLTINILQGQNAQNTLLDASAIVSTPYLI